MPIYIQYGDIKGSVSAEGHAEWVDVNSCQWGVGRGIGSPTGRSANREASAPSISEVVVTKSMDKSSYRWLEQALQGEGLKCTIHFCKTDAGKLETYAEYILENCLVSGYSVSSGGDRPTESISINFTKIQFMLEEMGVANASTETPRVFYDIAKAVKG
jgi:type VI secretion system secreted protein Hcp